MAVAEIEYDDVELFEDDEFSPVQNQIMSADTQQIAACCGRRVGKTWSGARKLLEWILTDMHELWLEVDAGRRERWIGERMRPTVAQEQSPDVLYWVVAPRSEHLSQIRGNLLSILVKRGHRWQHPKFRDWLSNRNRNLWLWQDGVCGRIDFIPCTGQQAMVSRGLHGAWIDEAGFVPNDRYGALKPTLWEHGGRVLATGTPSLGEDHWFTKMAVSGLSEDDERFDPKIAKRDPAVTTFIASTVDAAYSERARREALKDARFWGEIWAAQWIYADWRLRALQVFREWSNEHHLVSFSRPQDRPGAVTAIGRRPWCTIGKTPIYSAPDMTYGVVDWSGGTAPGAAVVAMVWKENPIGGKEIDGSPVDPRPLVLVVEDYEGHEPYTKKGGWWDILAGLERRWGVERWVGDPHNPHLIRQARRNGIYVEEGAYQDKAGRISLVAALLHMSKGDGVLPALYVSDRCQHVPREMTNYRWRRTRDGQTTDKPRDSDDHTLDCLAMLVPEIFSGGGVLIGGHYFG